MGWRILSSKPTPSQFEAVEIGMMTSHEALQARVAVLGELNSAELNAGRLAELLTNWVQEALGLSAEVELSETFKESRTNESSDESAPKTTRMPDEPELTATHWRFPLVYRGRKLGRLTIAMPSGNEDAVRPTVVQDLVNEFSRLLDQARRFELAHEEALKDELTGLGNRRMFERSL